MTTCDKILGIQVDENLTWNSHFNFLSKKLSSYMWLLSKIRTYLSTEHRLLFYNAYIKPHLDYCSLIWSNTSNLKLNKVNKLQRRSCKLILGIAYNGLMEAFKRLNILSFDQSIFLSKATSSPKGNDRSPENKQVFLNSSLVSKRFFQLVKGSQLCSPWLTKF